MKVKDFREKVPLFGESLRDKIREDYPNAQVTIREMNPSNIWRVSIREGYTIDNYLIWTGRRGHSGSTVYRRFNLEEFAEFEEGKYFWLCFKDGESVIGEEISEGIYQTKYGMVDLMREFIQIRGPIVPPTF